MHCESNSFVWKTQRKSIKNIYYFIAIYCLASKSFHETRGVYAIDLLGVFVHEFGKYVCI